MFLPGLSRLLSTRRRGGDPGGSTLWHAIHHSAVNNHFSTVFVQASLAQSSSYVQTLLIVLRSVTVSVNDLDAVLVHPFFQSSRS